MVKSAIAANVKKIIKMRCLAQGAIGMKAGYNIKTFSNMLNGRKIITDVDVIKIANALEVEPNELYGIKPKKEVVWKNGNGKKNIGIFTYRHKEGRISSERGEHGDGKPSYIGIY